MVTEYGSPATTSDGDVATVRQQSCDEVVGSKTRPEPGAPRRPNHAARAALPEPLSLSLGLILY